MDGNIVCTSGHVKDGCTGRAGAGESAKKRPGAANIGGGVGVYTGDDATRPGGISRAGRGPTRRTDVGRIDTKVRSRCIRGGPRPPARVTDLNPERGDVRSR